MMISLCTHQFSSYSHTRFTSSHDKSLIFFVNKCSQLLGYSLDSHWYMNSPLYAPKIEAIKSHIYIFIVRPLQINSLFPIHRPHLVTISSKCSIIPYSSIILRLFLHTDKCHLEQCQLTCHQCYKVGTNFTFVLYLQL